MKRGAPWALGAGTLAVAGALVVWGITEGLEERERERGPGEAAGRLLRDAAGNALVTLDGAAQKRIGLEVRALDPAESLQEVQAYGRVVDPSPLVEECGEIASAAAALAASRAEHDRVKALHGAGQNVSRRSLEAAEAQFRSDEVRLRTLDRLLAGRWGLAVAGLSPLERETFIDRLVKREAALVRVHLPLGESLPGLPSGATITPAGARDRRFRAEGISAAPAVDEKLQGRAFLLQVNSPSPFLFPGAAVTAHLLLPGTPRKGVVVPRSAVVRFEGASWVYLREGAERFLRREIALEHPVEEGWFLTNGVAAGDSIVVTGAQALLSEETRSQIRLEEE